jgi:hypothetical protein
MDTEKKWSGELGPIQLKRFKEALGGITRAGQSHRELSGVKGVSERSSGIFWSPFSPPSEEASKRLVALGDKFAWTVTKANLPTIIAEAEAITKELYTDAFLPTQDERITPEEDAERTAAHAANEAARKAASDDRAARIAARRAALLPNYPWVERKRTDESDHAWAGRNMRAGLAVKFPGISFRVTTDYNSARVRWELGPTYKQVKEFLAQFERWGYDTDGAPETEELKAKRIEHEAVTSIIGGLRYISESRDIPPEIYGEVGRMICTHLGKPFIDLQQGDIVEGSNDRLADFVYRTISATEWPHGSKIVRLKPWNEDWSALSAECYEKYGEGWAMESRRAELSQEHRDKLEALEAIDNAGRDPQQLWEIILASPVPGPALPAVASSSGIRVVHNLQHSGVELHFPGKPDALTLSRVKGSGWRWSRHGTCWYKKYSGAAWEEAHRIAGIEVPRVRSGSDPAGAMVQAEEDYRQDEIARAIGA